MKRAPRGRVHRVPRRRQLERAPVAAERRLDVAAPLLQPRGPLEQRRLFGGVVGERAQPRQHRLQLRRLVGVLE